LKGINETLMITSITIPLKLVSEANCSQHWTKKNKRHKQQKMIVKSYLYSYMPAYHDCLNVMGAKVIITLTRSSPRQFDSDNLQSSFKWIRDTIAGWLTNTDVPGWADNDARITWIYEQKKTTNKEHYITIQIENTSYS